MGCKKFEIRGGRKLSQRVKQSAASKPSETPTLDRLQRAIQRAGLRPNESEPQAAKKGYSERVSNEVAPALAAELRQRGLRETQPREPEERKSKTAKGSERRIAGGLGDKKVDVTFATEHAGLVLGVSVKTISWKDQKTKNFQKNLQNRKADLIFEVTTLHKRFPYAVVGGLMLLYEDAERDNLEDGNQKKSRISTYLRAHQLLKIFNHRSGTRNEDSKFEFLALGLYGADPPSYRLSEAGSPDKNISLDDFLSKLLQIVAERNPEDFIYQSGRLWKPRELGFGETVEETPE
jgi:hypothetical protein